jgi:hypothetical protein
MKVNDSFEMRFWSKVKKTDTCWLWTASTVKGKGYGQIGALSDGTMVKAHRASYFLACGEIPEGLLVCHKCDNPPCVNPEHLFLGTTADNHADRDQKNRQAKGAKSGKAKLQPQQVLAIRELVVLGELKEGEIAKMFNISPSNVYMIASRRTWRHL